MQLVSSSRRNVNIWPGFVDALAALLIVIAISILGTSRGPAIDSWLHDRRREETDPQVAELIDEILNKRR